ncbi:MAG: crossover junction endodeoxyribonuclease RuvC [Gammaproteobacteria bacterium]
MIRILGLDPGSRVTGYGVVDAAEGGVRYVASGCIRVGDGAMALRLLEIHRLVTGLVDAYGPGEVAIERVFVHKNPDSALKLGQARGAARCGACHAGAEVFEYAPRAVKQSVTGTGAAAKGQVQHMIRTLLSVQGRIAADAADALAIALCHAHHRNGAPLRRHGARR